jgi:hypothetical protein
MNRSSIQMLATSLLLVAAACTANVEDPTVNQQGRGGDTTCIASCDSQQTSCVAKCTDDACKASCTTTHTTCVGSCSKDGG